MIFRGYEFLFAIVALILTVGLACSSLTTAPATQQPINSGNNQLDQPTEPQQPSNNSGSSGDLVTFTDQNNYFQIDVPADWTYKQSTGDNYYWDTFTSPDGDASIENITYDNGDPFPGETNGKFALNLLHQFYRVDGKEGDIRVKEDSIQKGGSERLIWNSRGRGTTGISFFVVRNGTTFLMFTSVYPSEQESQYLDTLNKVISSYVVP